jgi:hypothetical protein
MRSTFGSSSVLSARVGSFWISCSVSSSNSVKITSISTKTSLLEKTLIISSASAVISPLIVGTMISPVSMRVISEIGACGTSEGTSGVQEGDESDAETSDSGCETSEGTSGVQEGDESDAETSDSGCETSEGTSGVQEGAGSGAGASAGAFGTSTEIPPPSS